MTTALVMWLAVLLDALLGEPRRAHPLVAFGRWAGFCERWLHAPSRARGVLAWCMAVVPLVALAGLLSWACLRWSVWAHVALSALLVYMAIGLRSLREHALPVADALDAGDLVAAREAVGRMVSRDVQALDAERVAAAATESVLENGSDAVFAALFWYAVLGVPGVVLFRLANTLDAMWGYRTARYEQFGWAAARIDDVLNFIPARLVALTYALLGHAATAWRCWRAQAPHWESPNAGPVMASGAGSLRVLLGGGAPYHGKWVERPLLGVGEPADARGIRRAMRLVQRGVWWWLLLMAAGAWVVRGSLHA